MIKIAICDDDDFICSEIEQILSELKKESAIKMEVVIFHKGEHLIEFLHLGNKFDLIFLDVELGTTTGIEIGSKIRNELDDYLSKIVFVTSQDGYEQQLFDVQPLNFIKKPLEHEKIKKCVLLTKKLLEIQNKTFEYKKGFQIIIVSLKDILYFESKRKQIRIVTQSNEDYFYGKLENIKRLVDQSFVMPHKSFLVNFHKILKMTNVAITINNNVEIPISQRNLKIMRTKLIEFEKEKSNDWL